MYLDVTLTNCFMFTIWTHLILSDAPYPVMITIIRTIYDQICGANRLFIAINLWAPELWKLKIKIKNRLNTISEFFMNICDAWWFCYFCCIILHFLKSDCTTMRNTSQKISKPITLFIVRCTHFDTFLSIYSGNSIAPILFEHWLWVSTNVRKVQ